MNYYEWQSEDFKKQQKETARIISGTCGMYGPFELDRNVVIFQVGEQNVGNYRLSKCDLGVDFRVDYIGRSDKELAERICDHIKEGYKTFVWCAQENAAFAYRQECEDFHFFGGDIGLLENDKEDGHPHSPEGLGLKCRKCGN